MTMTVECSEGGEEGSVCSEMDNDDIDDGDHDDVCEDDDEYYDSVY